MHLFLTKQPNCNFTRGKLAMKIFILGNNNKTIFHCSSLTYHQAAETAVPAKEWRDDHGLTYVWAMVKIPQVLHNLIQ